MMNADRSEPAALAGNLAACVIVVICLFLGVVGLVLPIIPGLLFLAVAAVIVARRFPKIGARLKRHPSLGGVVDKADRFVDLPWPRKLQCGSLVCLKLVLDGLARVGAAAARLFGASRPRSAL